MVRAFAGLSTITSGFGMDFGLFKGATVRTESLETLIARCPVCLYAGSLVPPEVVAYAPEGAKVIDTAPMTLDDIIAEIEAAHAEGPRASTGRQAQRHAASRQQPVRAQPGHGPSARAAAA